MSRYPVLVALGNLASLTVQKQDAFPIVYALTRTERVAPNNDLALDDAGNVIWDVHLTRNGAPADYDAFASAYSALVATGVAGMLPAEDDFTGEPHTLYTFCDVDGAVHTIALTSYGVLHDAVSVDGHQAFYIAKGAFDLGLE